tara:strand:+ start:633 stop:803 length:171 start_codon:yes stop_codon:yes gene_type:complete
MMKKIKLLLFLIPFVTLSVATYLGYENYKNKKPVKILKNEDMSKRSNNCTSKCSMN